LTGRRKKELEQRVFRLTLATISWNIVEAAVAITCGVIAGSLALRGFGMDSLIEVASAFIIFWKLTGGRSADNEARENTARRGIAVTFLALALWISWESISILRNRIESDTSIAGIVLATLSLCIMPILGTAKMRLGRALKSRAIQADAIETLVCAWLSASLLAGLGLRAILNWWWADTVGALLMVPFLLWQTWETWEESGERD